MTIVYPMFWDYCLLSNLYYPFDMPSILLFVLGLDSIYRRNWWVPYPVLALSALNRDVSCVLIVAFAVCLRRRTPAGKVAVHIAAQVAICLGIAWLLHAASGTAPIGLSANILAPTPPP